MTKKTISFDELKGLLRARVTVSTSLRECARHLEVSPAYLSRILATPNAKIGPRVVTALGYRAITRYEKAPASKSRLPRKKAK